MEKEVKSKLFRTDTKSLVGSVIFGIVFLLVSQASGAVDNLFFWGKLGMLLLNGMVWAFFTGIIVLLYKQPAGILAGLIEGILSVFYSPLWLSLTLANLVGSIVFSLVASRCSMEKLSHHLTAQFFCNFLGNACVCLGLVLVLKIPLQTAVVESLITAGVDWIGASFLTKLVYGKLIKTGLA